MTNPERIEFVDKLLAQLSEHFDHVQILATWNENEGSFNLKRGSGNWYARQGLAHEFIQQDIAQENAVQIAEKLKPEE